MDFVALAKGQKNNSGKKPEPSKNNGKFEPRGVEAYHKKTNARFLSAPDAARAQRAQNLQETRKMKRTETVMAKRGLQLSNNSTRSTNSVISTASSDKSGKIKDGDARKEQLAKWKMEKALINQKQNIPPPFKAGVASANVAVTAPKAKGPAVPLPGTERRVTRAMAKLTVTSTMDKPKIKVQQADGKRPLKNFNAPPNGKGVPAGPVGRPEVKKDVVKKLFAKPKLTPSAPVAEPVVIAPPPAPAPAPKKKLKPKAIDTVYSEYNQLFSTACSGLMSHSKTWTPILEAGGDIPDDINDEIRSCLGKVKLLLDSKLPQFGVLLHSYLVEGADEGPPILPCDLQGWWDVANIQVVAVNAEFDKLRDLQSRNWVKLVDFEEPKPALVSNSNLGAGIGKKLSNLKKPAVKTASSGFKAFLAMKRKEKVEDGVGGSDAVDAEIETRPKSPVENNFQGGFFKIQTPIRRASIANANRSTLRIIGNGTPLTPGSRRLSASASANLSYKMFNFRNSIGARCKMGAQPPMNSSEEKEEEGMEINN